MAITEVGSGSQRAPLTGAGTDTGVAAFPGNVTAGNLMTCLGISWQSNPGNTTLTVTGTSGAYTVLLGAGVSSSGGLAREFIAYKIAPSSAAETVTVDPSGSGNFINAVITEWTGASIALDVDGGESTGSSTAPSDGLTTLTSGALVLGAMALANVAGTITPGSGYTELREDETAAISNFATEFKIAGGAGAQTVDWALVESQGWAVYTAAFKESVVGAPAMPGGVGLYSPRGTTQPVAGGWA